jgi:serine O-acetyltransferase
MSGLKNRIARWRLRLQAVLCCHIPRRYLKTVRFPHPMGIVIGDGVRIGRDVRIYQNVTIGLTENLVGARPEDYPTIEDEVFIYAGAVIFGAITIGARSIVGANAVISRDIPPDSIAYGYNQFRPRSAKSEGERPRIAERAVKSG